MKTKRKNLKMLLNRSLNIAFLTHKRKVDDGLPWYNAALMIDSLRKMLPGSTVDGIAIERGARNFNRTFKDALKSRYDLIVIDLNKQYEIEKTHAGFIAMNKFIKDTELPVLMISNDYSNSFRPATNFLGYNNKVAVVGQFEGIDMKSAGYGNVVYEKQCKAMPAMLRSSNRVLRTKKDTDFIYAGMLRNDRLRKVVDIFNMLSDNGFSCKFYGTDMQFDMNDKESKNILSKAKFECNKAVAAKDVISTMSNARFTIIPAYETLHDVIANRIYEDDTANALMLVDSGYGLSDVFDNSITYYNMDDLLSMARYFDEEKHSYDYALSNQHIAVARRWDEDRKTCQLVVEEAIRKLLADVR